MTLIVSNSITSGSLVDGEPFTVAGWFYIDSTAGTQQSTFFQRNTDNTFDGFQCVVTHDSGSGNMTVSALARQSITNASQALASTTAATGWHHGAAVFTSDTSRKAYLDYSTTDTDTTSINVDFGTDTYTSSIVRGLLPIGEMAVWDSALSDADVLRLSEGVPAFMVQPSNLIHYIPCYGGAQDFIQGDGYWTENGSLAEETVGQPPVLHRFGG